MTSREGPRPIAAGDCRESLARWAGCEEAAGGSAGEAARVVSDYLRHGLCHLGLEAGGGPARAVHVLQLLGALHRQLAGLIPEPDEPPWLVDEGDEEPSPGEERDPDVIGVHDLGRWALSRLMYLRECGHQGRGYHLPTPSRAVTLPSGTVLVISGLPTRSLAAGLGLKFRWAGLARAVSEPRGQLPDDLLQQALDDWLRRPSELLPVWTESMLGIARKRAVPTSGLDPSAFEIYAPHLKRNLGQKQKWVSPRSWRPPFEYKQPEPALCRTRNRPFRFWIAPLEEAQDGVRYRHESAVPPELVRRLMYGLDLRADAQESALVLTVPGGLRGERELRLYSWPAWEEYRLLQALAYDATPPKGPHLPLRFHVAVEWWPDVASVLQGLSILIRYDRTLDTVF